MKLIIDMRENLFKELQQALKNEPDSLNYYATVIANGTPYEEQPQGGESMESDLISRSELKKALCEFMKNNIGIYSNEMFHIVDSMPTVEERQGELTADESRLIGEAVNYLLGADLVEENGWSENDIKILQSLCESYYDEDSEEEE